MKALLNKKAVKILVIVLGALVLASPFLVQAAVGTAIGGFVTDVIAWIGLQLTYIFGTLLLALIDILIKIASYNNFINSEAVSIGWVIVRDIVNMFFVIVLLIIAFATILKIESYAYQRVLIKLILAVVWVNFSKMITGLFIDVGQVIMMTFVNAFKDIAAGNITFGFGLEDIVKMRRGVGAGTVARGQAVGDIGNLEVLGAILLGLVFLIVACAVILIMIVFLLVRIIYLWILAIFSPVAFILPMVPGGQKYSSQWWQNLSKYIVLGPVLAFFLWLTFTLTARSSENSRRGVIELQRAESTVEGTMGEDEQKWFGSEISGTQKMFNFVVTTALLIMAIGFAQEVGGVAGKFAGAVQGKMSAAGMGALKLGKKAALGSAKFAATRPTRMANWGLRTFAPKGSLAGKWAKDIYDRREKTKDKKRLTLMEKLGMGDEAIRHIAATKPVTTGWKRFGLKRLATGLITNRTRKAAAREFKSLETTEASLKDLNSGNGPAVKGEVGKYKASSFTGTGRTLKDEAHDLFNGVLSQKGISRQALDEFTVRINNGIAKGKGSDAYDTAVDLRNSLLDAIAATYAKDGGFKNTDLNDWVISGGNGLKMDDPRDGVTTLDIGAIKTLGKNVHYMRDISAEKQDATQAKVKEHGGMKFFKSDEYQNNKDKYYTREEYVDNVGYERWAKKHGKGGMSVGSFGRGKSDHASVDFNHLKDIKGLEGIEGKGGVNMADLTAEQQQALAAKMSQLVGEKYQALKDQYAGVKDEDIPHADRIKMRDYHQALDRFSKPENLSDLTLYNTAREGVSARRLITHEAKHGVLEDVDNGGEIRDEVWNEHSKAEKQRIIQQVKDKQGDQTMSNDEAMEEYFAEALTNITMWGDKSENAIKMDPKYLNMFENKVQELIEKGSISEGGIRLQSDIQISQKKSELVGAENELGGWLKRLEVKDVAGLDAKKAAEGPTFLTDEADRAVLKVKNIQAELDGLEFNRGKPILVDTRLAGVNKQIDGKRAELDAAKIRREAALKSAGVDNEEGLERTIANHGLRLRTQRARKAVAGVKGIENQLEALQMRQAQYEEESADGMDQVTDIGMQIEKMKQQLAAAKAKKEKAFKDVGVSGENSEERLKMLKNRPSLRYKVDTANTAIKEEKAIAKEIAKLAAQQTKIQGKSGIKVVEPAGRAKGATVKEVEQKLKETQVVEKKTVGVDQPEPIISKIKKEQLGVGAMGGGDIIGKLEDIHEELKGMKGLLAGLGKTPEGKAAIAEIKGIQNKLLGGKPVRADNLAVLKAVGNLGHSLKQQMGATQFGMTKFSKKLAGITSAVADIGSAGEEPMVIHASLTENVRSDVEEIVDSLPKN